MKNKPLYMSGLFGQQEVEYLLSIESRPLPNADKNKWSLELHDYDFIFNLKHKPSQLLTISCFHVELSFKFWLDNFDKKISRMVNEKNEPLGTDFAMGEYKRKVARNMFLKLTKAYWKNYSDNCWCDVNEVFARTIKFYND